MTRNAAKHEALLDELLKDYTDPKDILGAHGLLKQLTKRVMERALAAELTARSCKSGNTRLFSSRLKSVARSSVPPSGVKRLVIGSEKRASAETRHRPCGRTR